MKANNNLFLVSMSPRVKYSCYIMYSDRDHNLSIVRKPSFRCDWLGKEYTIDSEVEYSSMVKRKVDWT